MLERISTCSLVCRAWRTRAQAHLFKNIITNHEGLHSLDKVLRTNPAISSSIVYLMVVKKSKTPSISFFAIRHQLSKLTFLQINGFDFTREHAWLCRSPLFRSVRALRLYTLQICQLSQLIRFINCFHSLASLEIDFDFYQLEHKGQILPKPSGTETRSLKWLKIELIPGVSRLIDWFLTEESCLSQLNGLLLYIRMIKDEATFGSCFEGLDGLLESCRNSIENFTLRLESVPMVESVSDIGQHISSSANLRGLLICVPSSTRLIPKSEAPHICFLRERLCTSVCNPSTRGNHFRVRPCSSYF